MIMIFSKYFKLYSSEGLFFAIYYKPDGFQHFTVSRGGHQSTLTFSCSVSSWYISATILRRHIPEVSSPRHVLIF